MRVAAGPAARVRRGGASADRRLPRQASAAEDLDRIVDDRWDPPVTLGRAAGQRAQRRHPAPRPGRLRPRVVDDAVAHERRHRDRGDDGQQHHQQPPPAAAVAVPTIAAEAPCTTSATRGPPATTTMKMPWSRPRSSSDAAVCSMLIRNAAEAMSAPPPTHQHQHAPRPASGVRHATAERPPARRRRRSRPWTAPRPGRRRSPPGPARRPARPSPSSTPPITAPAGMAAKSSGEREPALLRPEEALVRDLREERPRHPEDHRDDVDDERHHQHRAACAGS